MKKIPFIICILIAINLQAQYQDKIFEKVHSYPKTFNTVKDLSYRIQNDYVRTEDQVKALYIWIATNIEYDLQQHYSLKTARVIFFSSEKERQLQLNNHKKELLKKILQKKKGICEEYAILLKAVCDELKIPAVVINGFTKLDTQLINSNPGFKNHSWNAVFFNESWHLIDVTWGAGYEIEGEKKWLFNYNEDYFDPNPNQFIKHHLPQDPNWQLLNLPITKDSFFAKPVFFNAYFKSGTKISKKQSGSIIKKKSIKYVTVHFDELPKNKSDFRATTRISKYPKKIRFLKNFDGSYTGKIKIKHFSEFLTIYYQNKAILDFKIISDQE